MVRHKLHAIRLDRSLTRLSSQSSDPSRNVTEQRDLRGMQSCANNAPRGLLRFSNRRCCRPLDTAHNPRPASFSHLQTRARIHVPPCHPEPTPTLPCPRRRSTQATRPPSPSRTSSPAFKTRTGATMRRCVALHLLSVAVCGQV